MTLLEQLAELIAKLNEVKALCDNLIQSATAQQTKYQAAAAAQGEASTSLAEVMSFASQVIEKIGN